MIKKENNKSDPLMLENEDLMEKLKQLESKLAMSNSAFLNIVGKSLDGIVIVNQDKMVVYANYAVMELFDKNIADLLGEPLTIPVDPLALATKDTNAMEINIPHTDGSTSIAEISILNTEWNNEACHVVSFRDITERKKTEEVLSYMAEHDFMTDLPNRVAFEKHMTESIKRARTGREHMAVLYLDLDNFKLINDTLGHDSGDALLKEISKVLKRSIRQGDTVARLGGDEFAIILNGLRKTEYAGRVAQTILNELEDPFDFEDKKIYSNASIGIAVYPYGGTTAVDLLKNADTAMYSAKHNGKNQYRFYSADLNETNERILLISTGLRKALCSGLIELDTFVRENEHTNRGAYDKEKT
jgi:diguanylate cyclase (GGDEF)-like protein/PAS domain S-box-containing protein